MLGIPLRYLLKHPVIAVADLAADPLQVWTTIQMPMRMSASSADLSADTSPMTIGNSGFMTLGRSMAVQGDFGVLGLMARSHKRTRSKRDSGRSGELSVVE